MIDFKGYAEWMLDELSRFQELLENVMAPLPKDWIIAQKKKNSFYYYRSGRNRGGKAEYIKKDDVKAISDLIKYQVCRQIMDRVAEMRVHLEAFISVCGSLDLNDIEMELPEGFRDFPRELFGELGLVDRKQIKVQSENEYLGFSESLIYQTLSGIWVRSLAEQRIADSLYLKEIPFEYEPALPQANGPERRPDFRVFFARENRWVYLEHFGMMSLKSYREEYKRKIHDYTDLGLVLGYDLFCTYFLPNGTFDQRSLDLFIERALPKDKG